MTHASEADPARFLPRQPWCRVIPCWQSAPPMITDQQVYHRMKWIDSPAVQQLSPQSAARAPEDSYSPTSRRTLIRSAGAVGLAALAGCAGGRAPDRSSAAAALGQGMLYNDPSCTCCDRYASYLASYGLDVTIKPVDGMEAMKSEHGVPVDVESCHTIDFGDYIVEGHVPIQALESLVSDRPAIDGIALPGMPAGSPGMGGEKAAPFTIYAFDDGHVEPFMEV